MAGVAFTVFTLAKICTRGGGALVYAVVAAVVIVDRATIDARTNITAVSAGVRNYGVLAGGVIHGVRAAAHRRRDASEGLAAERTRRSRAVILPVCGLRGPDRGGLGFPGGPAG